MGIFEDTTDEEFEANQGDKDEAEDQTEPSMDVGLIRVKSIESNLEGAGTTEAIEKGSNQLPRRPMSREPRLGSAWLLYNRPRRQKPML